MGIQVTFSYPAWIAQFPEFSNVAESSIVQYYTDPSTGQTLTLGYLGLAQQYQRNDGGGPVTDAGQQLNLLNLMVAHIAQLYASQVNGQPDLRAGRRNLRLTWSGGSIAQPKVAFRLGWRMPTTPAAAWFNQTKYGAAWWQMTAPYRTMRYLTPPPRIFNPPIWGGGSGGNDWNS